MEKEISVRDDVTLNNVQGNVVGFMKNVRCQRLLLENMILALDDNTGIQTFNFIDEVRLHNVKGDVGGLLENIKCKRLVLREARTRR